MRVALVTDQGKTHLALQAAIRLALGVDTVVTVFGVRRAVFRSAGAADIYFLLKSRVRALDLVVLAVDAECTDEPGLRRAVENTRACAAALEQRLDGPRVRTLTMNPETESAYLVAPPPLQKLVGLEPGASKEIRELAKAKVANRAVNKTTFRQAWDFERRKVEIDARAAAWLADHPEAMDSFGCAFLRDLATLRRPA